MLQDETLYSIADKVSNFAVIYLVDISEVPDFNKVRWCGRSCSWRSRDLPQMYELYDPCTTMFFFRNKHIMVDLGTG